MLAWAASDRPAATMQWRALLPMAQSWPPPRFPLTGEEVMAAGVAEGPAGRRGAARGRGLVGRPATSPDDKLALIERLKSVAQGMAY